MAETTTLDQLCEGHLSVLDRWLPWRRRALVMRAAQKRLDKMTDTVNGIISDHGLDDLMCNIETTRARGQAAMEAEERDTDRQEEKSDKADQSAAVG